MQCLRWGAVLVSVLLLVVLGTGIGVSEAVVDEPNNETDIISLQETDGVTIASELQNESGEVQVLLEFESLETGQSVEALKTHAEESQSNFERFAEATDGLTVDNEFWITSAVAATVDTDQVEFESLAEVEGVSAIQPTITVETAADVDRSSSSGIESPLFSTSGEPTARAPSLGVDTTTEFETTYGLEQIRAPEAWDAHDTRGEGVRVAVLDTGIDIDHPDLDLWTADPSDPTYPGGWAEFDDWGNQVDSEPYDENSHGTHVSGTVAGGNASGQHIGVAPDAELMHGKVLNDDGSGNGFQILAGMEWAAENDADVLSLSLGSEGYSETFIDPVRNARAAGITVIISSGNDGEDTSNSPGNVFDAVSVGATDIHEDVASYSSGETIVTDEAWDDPPEDWPEEYVVPSVAAPGSAVWSALPGGDYENKWGTSMAAPHVSGAVVLAQSATTVHHSPTEIGAALEATAWKPSDWDGPKDERDERYGSGIIDVPAVISYLETEIDQPDIGVTNAILANASIQAGETAVVEATVQNSGDASGNFTAELLVDEEVVETASVRLEPGETETVTFEHTFETFGRYQIAVNDVAAGELLVEDPIAFEVISTSVEPTEVEPEEQVMVNATATNVDDRNGTATLALTVDGEPVLTETLMLKPGESAVAVFETMFAERGEYAIAVGDTSAGTVTVERSITPEITDSSLSAAGVQTGEPVTATATIENPADAVGEATVGLVVDSETVTTQSFVLQPRESTEVSFERTFGEAGVYEIALNDTPVTDLTVTRSLELQGITVTPEAPETDEVVTVNATLENVDDTDGPFTVAFAANDAVVGVQELTVPVEETVNTTFEHTFEESGEYNLAIVGTHAGTVTVEDTEPSLEDYRNEDGIVTTGALREAIADWRGGEIEVGLLREVISAWRQG